MSVLIKGLTKPHSCGDCMLWEMCDKWRNRNWGDSPPEDCPIEAAPADVVEVVRCGDCIRKDICRTSNVWAVSPDDNWFCADGERKDGGQDDV